MSDILEDRVTSEEFKLWKKNCSFYYDFLMSRSLEYPSTIVRWLNDAESLPDDPKNSERQSVLFSAKTYNDEENYLLIASIIMPGYSNSNKEVLEEYGIFSTYNDTPQISVKLAHNGVPISAACMPQKEQIIASLSSTNLYIYKLNNNHHYNIEEFVDPIYTYHNLNSQCLDWSLYNEGDLLTTFESSQLAIWDLSSQKKRKNFQPKQKLNFMKNCTEDSIICDTSWHPKHCGMVGGINSKGSIFLGDIRSNDSTRIFIGHKSSGLQLKFNQFSDYVFITSGTDNNIFVWDLRFLGNQITSIQYKNENFPIIKWSKHCETLFGAVSKDKRVYFFDLDLIFDDLLPHDMESGPSSLLFSHGGHTSKVCDFDWNSNPNQPFMVCSVSEDNVFQTWQMTTKMLTLECAHSISKREVNRNKNNNF